MKKILFVQGVYDTMDLFSTSLGSAYEKMGYETIFLPIQEESEYKKILKQIDPNEIVAMVTFNNLAYRIELEEHINFWEKYQIPYVDILMDHPFHYKEKLRQLPNTAIVLCTDRNHVAFLKKYEPILKCVAFLPHAGTKESITKRKLMDREMEVLYAGSLPFVNASLMVPDLSLEDRFDAIDMSKYVLDTLIEHSNQTTEEAICAYLEEKKLFFSTEETYDIIYKMRFLDSYATSYFREWTIRVLVEAGIDVFVYGSGWEICEWIDNPHFHWMGKVLAQDILPLMEEAKIVLSTQTWYKDGAHDRIFNGMLQRACVLTDTSKYLLEEFKDQKDIVFFEREKINELPKIVERLKNDPENMQKIADQGYESAKKKHSWEIRAKQILAMIDQA